MVNALGEAWIRGLVEIYSYVELSEREYMFPKRKPPAMTLQERVIYNMLTEAHVHLLDSGSAYGRNWERWRARGDPRLLPKATLYESNCCNTVDISPRINTFHWLNDNFEYLQKVDYEFRKLDAETGRRLSWPELIERYAEQKDLVPLDHGNTYNDEYDLLENIIQFYIIGEDGVEWPYANKDEVIIFIQTHNGCDIRGGYSTPHPFTVKDEYIEPWQALYDFRDSVYLDLVRHGRAYATFYWGPGQFELEWYNKDVGPQFREVMEDIQGRSEYDRDEDSQWQTFQGLLRWNKARERFYVKLSGKTFYLKARPIWW